MTTVADALRDVRRALERAGIESAARDARDLVALSLGVAPEHVRLMASDPFSHDSAQILGDLLPDRLARKPMSHITRQRAFWKHDFYVTPDVLDPRPETEVLVEAALAGPVHRVLDLGTGSGAILLSLLAERPRAEGLGVDRSGVALEVARINATRLAVQERARFLVGDWFAPVTGRFDLIVSNPPYIAADEMDGLAPELSYEPRMALTDEEDGLSAYRAIASGAPGHLTPGGRLMVEIGPTQAAAVMGIFEAAGLRDITVSPDLDGRDRVVSARVN